MIWDSIHWPPFVPPGYEATRVNHAFRQLTQYGVIQRESLEEVLNTRVPVLRHIANPSLPVDFDLSFAGYGIRNSWLLRQYLMTSETVRIGGLVVKAWAKDSRVIDSRNGYLSSYAVVLMWISYLLKRALLHFSPPLCTPRIPYRPSDQYHVPLTLDSVKFEELQDLLEGFFVYYTEKFAFESSVVTLRSASGEASRTERRFKYMDGNPLCIEDPYENNLNLGRRIEAEKFVLVKKVLQAEREKYQRFRSAMPTQQTWEGLQHSGPPNDSGQAPLIGQRLSAPSSSGGPSGLRANAMPFVPAELLRPAVVQKLREINETPTMSLSSIADHHMGGTHLVNSLGMRETAQSRGQPYTQQEQYAQALTSHPKDVKVWTKVGISLGVQETGQSWGQRSTKQKQRNKHADAWKHLGQSLGVGEAAQVGSQRFTKQQCFIQALTFNHKDADTWKYLGQSLGVGEAAQVGSHRFTNQQCFTQALTFCPKDAHAWTHLGNSLGVGEAAQVGSHRFTNRNTE